MTETGPATQEHQTLDDVALRIQTAWQRLLGPDGADLARPTDLSARWQLDQTMCIRIFRALKEGEPLLALHRLPAPPSLRQTLAAAGRADLPTHLIADASDAVEQFERLIRAAGGTKGSLDTLVARHFDHTREKVETGAKQLIHRGMSQLYGVEAQTSVILCFVVPGEDPDWHDELIVHGYHKLRRLRPELPLVLGSREILESGDENEQAGVLRSLHGRTICPEGSTTALQDFCTDPMPPIDLRPDGNRLLYVLGEEPRELPHDVDLFFGSRHRRSDPAHATDEQRRARFALVPQNPSCHAVLDVFLHRDVWPSAEPELVIAKIGNPANETLLAHSLDRADFVESLQRLGTEPNAVNHPAYPDHAKLVGWVNEQMGWNRQDFRLFRCVVKYPVVGLWYTVQIQLPDA